MKHLSLFIALALMACNSCVPAPSPLPPLPPQPCPDPVPFPPEPYDSGPAPMRDAGPEPDIDRSVRDACANASKLGCSEAVPVEPCLRVTQRALAERLTIVPLACMVGARSKTDMQRCGFIGCK